MWHTLLISTLKIKKGGKLRARLCLPSCLVWKRIVYLELLAHGSCKEALSKKNPQTLQFKYLSEMLNLMGGTEPPIESSWPSQRLVSSLLHLEQITTSIFLLQHLVNPSWIAFLPFNLHLFSLAHSHLQLV